MSKNIKLYYTERQIRRNKHEIKYNIALLNTGDSDMFYDYKVFMNHTLTKTIANQPKKKQALIY